jgi:WhiB family transcriptional regulator, redox-sensing transcriptional regulator
VAVGQESLWPVEAKPPSPAPDTLKGSLEAQMAWTTRAACLDMPLDLFFPSNSDPAFYRTARTICKSCPVRKECLELALDMENGLHYGMFGGLTPDERRDLQEETA